MKLRVNGDLREVHASPATPLLYVLRNDCGLKGSRFGCGAAQCGACHVLVDGVPLPACDTPLWSAEGKDVVTVEGLAGAAGLPGVQPALVQAFIDEQAAQCGYCLSGILVTAAALLGHTPEPDDAAVRAALDKHLCRCGAHNRIVRAVLRAAAKLREPANQAQEEA